jgi:SAM-dependent methyltransferase
MSAIPTLFDRDLLRRRLDRALATGEPGAAFLVDRAAADLGERLSAVLRTFEQAADLATPTDAAARILAASGQVGSVVRITPSLAGPAPGSIPLVLADAEHPPLRPESLDLVVSLLALQTVNDLPGAFSRIRAALRPDGLFLGALLGGATLTELRQSFTQAEAEVEGGASPHVAPFADVRDLGGLLQRAGFALPVTDLDAVTVRYRDAFALMADLRQMGAANALEARRRTPLRRATLLRMAEIYAERFADPDGRIRATFEIVWVSGWAPHGSQQQPLRPGSAKMRLADALRVPEGEPPQG